MPAISAAVQTFFVLLICTGVSICFYFYPHECYNRSKPDEITSLDVSDSTIRYHYLPTVLGLMTIISALPFIPWLLFRFIGFLGTNKQMTNCWKDSVILLVIVIVSTFKIYLMSTFVYANGRKTIYWGIYLAISLVFDVDFKPDMLPDRVAEKLPAFAHVVTCRAYYHTAHNVMFVLLYWYFLVSIVYRTGQLLSHVLYVFNVQIVLKWRRNIVSWGRHQRCTVHEKECEKKCGCQEINPKALGGKSAPLKPMTDPKGQAVASQPLSAHNQGPKNV